LDAERFTVTSTAGSLVAQRVSHSTLLAVIEKAPRPLPSVWWGDKMEVDVGP